MWFSLFSYSILVFAGKSQVKFIQPLLNFADVIAKFVVQKMLINHKCIFLFHFASLQNDVVCMVTFSPRLDLDSYTTMY